MTNADRDKIIENMGAAILAQQSAIGALGLAILQIGQVALLSSPDTPERRKLELALAHAAELAEHYASLAQPSTGDAGAGPVVDTNWYARANSNQPAGRMPQVPKAAAGQVLLSTGSARLRPGSGLLARAGPGWTAKQPGYVRWRPTDEFEAEAVSRGRAIHPDQSRVHAGKPFGASGRPGSCEYWPRRPQRVVGTPEEPYGPFIRLLRRNSIAYVPARHQNRSFEHESEADPCRGWQEGGWSCTQLQNDQNPLRRGGFERGLTPGW